MHKHLPATDTTGLRLLIRNNVYYNLYIQNMGNSITINIGAISPIFCAQYMINTCLDVLVIDFFISIDVT